MDISISLSPELIGLITTRVESGRNASTSEVVQEALLLLERSDEWQADHRRLRQAWTDGLESGDAGALDFDDLKAEARCIQSGRKKD